MASDPPPSRLEVRVAGLSVSADVAVSTDKTPQDTLPTLPTVVYQGLRSVWASSSTTTKHVLKNVNVVFKPGTMTLVLGQAGSGKSTLLKLLSGRFPSSRVTKVEGEVLYNGATAVNVGSKLPQAVAYVAQRDVHFATLTVQETLAFAHECCSRGQHLGENADAMTNRSHETVARQLGLEDCKDTVVGDDMLRGVSGGERKRVTMGEMQFGDKAIVCLDEITTGLDSATAYDIVKTQLQLARELHKTVVMSLLQPSPELFELFDAVLILKDGYVIFNGPRDSVLSYFEGLGFVCPADRDVADFVLDIGTRQQYAYEKGLPAGSKYPRTATEMSDAFERSVVYQAVLADVYAPIDPRLIKDREDLFHALPEFQQSGVPETLTLLRQQAKVTWRNVPFIASRVVMVVLMGLINGSVFWQTDPKEGQIVLGVLFQAVLFIAFGQSAQIPTFFAARGVFYKHRMANFYRTSSYVIAFSVNQLPLSIMETLTFGSIIYWMCGLASSASSFVIFEVLLLLTSTAFTSLFFFFGASAPSLPIANAASLIVLTFVMLYGGFAISATQMPDALVWIYWIDPFTWVMRALVMNQYRTAEFDVPVYDGIDYYGKFGKNMGEFSLELVGLETEKKWLWLGIVYIVGMNVVFMVLSWACLEYCRFEQQGDSDLEKAQDAGRKRRASDSPHSSTESEYMLAHTPRGDSSGDVIVEMKSMTQQKVTPVTLAFKNLWYTVPDPKNAKQRLDLIKGISGYASPGTITALMGSSGAGKTTLMDVMAGRKTGGEIQGQVFLNGYPATPLAIQRSTGYCEQMDFHSESSTFREALVFTSFLRQGDGVSDSAKLDWVEEILGLLELRPIANQIIRGSSAEQLKRLTIGVELAARQSVLFLDEPTTGLDARAAKLIMDSVRKVANMGVTVVCTIHQPSAEVFQVFDRLLLLKRGGVTVYFGDIGRDACDIVKYLESIDGVKALEEGYNPATWMLEVIGAGVSNTDAKDTDFETIFNQSREKDSMEAMLDGMMSPSDGSSPLSFSAKRAASNVTQLKFLLGRFVSLHWRTASYDLVRVGLQFSMGLIFAISYAAIDYETYQGVNGGMAMIHMTTFFSSFIAITSVIPVLGGDRAAFYRERASQTYNTIWYFLAALITEIPFLFLCALIFTTVLFPSVGFVGRSEFFLYWLHVAMFGVMMTSFGMFLAFWQPTAEVATGFGILCMSIWGLFVGFNPPASAIPKGYEWLHQITPHRYTVEALASIVLGNCDGSDPSRVACKTLLGAPPTLGDNLSVSDFLGAFYGMTYDHVWRDLGVVFAFTGVFGFLALLSLRFVNHMKR